MIRHVALFKWQPEVSHAQIEAVEEALGTMAGRVATIRDYRFGRDVGLADGNYDFAVVADFDDADGFRAYATDDEHRRVIVDHIQPLVDTVVRIQFAL